MASIPLTRGKTAEVDDADFEWLSRFKWCAYQGDSGVWYAARTVYVDGRKTSTTMHRFIMQAHRGQRVDHRDGDGLNNRRHNLRLATASQNRQNSKSHAGSRSRFKGVYFVRNGQRPWKACINTKNGFHYLGVHATEEDAARAVDSKAIELYGEFARLNFPVTAPVA